MIGGYHDGGGMYASCSTVKNQLTIIWTLVGVKRKVETTFLLTLICLDNVVSLMQAYCVI